MTHSDDDLLGDLLDAPMKTVQQDRRERADAMAARISVKDAGLLIELQRSYAAALKAYVEAAGFVESATGYYQHREYAPSGLPVEECAKVIDVLVGKVKKIAGR